MCVYIYFIITSNILGNLKYSKILKNYNIVYIYIWRIH